MQRVLVTVAVALAVVGLVPFVQPSAEVAASGADAADIGASVVGFNVGTTASSFTWSSLVQGDFSLRFVFSVPTVMQCTFIAKSAGGVAASPLFHYFGHDVVGRTWTMWAQPYPGHVHAGSVAVTTITQGGLWAAQSTHTITLTGSEPWIYAGFGLRGWNNPTTNGNSVVLTLTCPSAVTLTGLEGGKQSLGVIPERMRGGVGLSTPSAQLLSANVLDSAGRSFTEPNVHFRWRSEDTAAGGTLHADTPGADSTWLLLGDDDLFTDGGPGSWFLDLDGRVSAGPQSAVGVILGMRNVASADAAAAI